MDYPNANDSRYGVGISFSDEEETTDSDITSSNKSHGTITESLYNIGTSVSTKISIGIQVVPMVHKGVQTIEESSHRSSKSNGRNRVILTPGGLEDDHQGASRYSSSSSLQLPNPNVRKNNVNENNSVSSGSGSTGSSAQIIKDEKYEGDIVRVLMAHRKKKICNLAILLIFLAAVVISVVFVILRLAR